MSEPAIRFESPQVAREFETWSQQIPAAEKKQLRQIIARGYPGGDNVVTFEELRDAKLATAGVNAGFSERLSVLKGHHNKHDGSRRDVFESLKRELGSDAADAFNDLVRAHLELRKKGSTVSISDLAHTYSRLLQLSVATRQERLPFAAAGLDSLVKAKGGFEQASEATLQVLRDDIAKETRTAVPFAVFVGSRLAEGPTERRAEYQQIVSAALNVVASYPPKGDHLFSWKGDRASLKTKTVSLVISDITEMKSIAGDTLAPDIGKPMSVDASTFVGRTFGDVDIRVHLAMDRIFFHSNGEPRTDGMARLIAALGHEIYGNVSRELRLAKVEKFSHKDRIEAEVDAFSRGIEFVERVLADDRLPDKTHSDLTAILIQDQVMLQSLREELKKLR